MKAGMACGFGKEIYQDGSRYEGVFCLDKKSGHGKMYYSDGSVYNGLWGSDVPNGEGTYTFQDGRKISGKWLNGKLGEIRVPSIIPPPIEILIESAENGDSESQYNLAVDYEKGDDGLKKDPYKAFRLYELSANQGFVRAEYAYGLCILNGVGTEQNVLLGQEWIKKAAEHGDSYAQYAMGVFNERGNGMEINYIEALKWYKLAAIAGIRDAQNNLAMFYLKGMGTKVDLVAAIK